MTGNVSVADNGRADGAKTISMKDRKAIIARRFITKNAVKISALTENICKGEKSTFEKYEALIGPVPEDA